MDILARTLVEHDERELVAYKRGATRLGFALMLKFFEIDARFPRHVGEYPPTPQTITAHTERLQDKKGQRNRPRTTDSFILQRNQMTLGHLHPTITPPTTGPTGDDTTKPTPGHATTSDNTSNITRCGCSTKGCASVW
ncbi:MAG: hypothetical protein ACR2JX_01025 [Mycobacteriales bacterium]